MTKSKLVIDLLDHFSQKFYGRTLTESLKLRSCVTCGQTAAAFRDELSKKVYAISGMCQDCQDEVFGK